MSGGKSSGHVRRIKPISPFQKAKGRITRLIIENFKSWGGTSVLGPFDNFSCIIGPNGSGKSNIMDAISFVFGQQAHDLRGKKVEDLIHKSPPNDENGDPTSLKETTKHFCFVFLNYLLFFIFILTQSSPITHFVNGVRVKSQEYKDQVQPIKLLKLIGVDVKSPNFLVYQGDVELIAQKNGKQLVEWMERVSGSIQYKEEYDQKFKEKEEVLLCFCFLKNLTKEKSNMRRQKEEARAFTEKMQELRETQREYYMFQLYNLREDLAIATEGIETKNQREFLNFSDQLDFILLVHLQEVETIKKRLEENDEVILSKQADLSKAQTNAKKMEKTLKKQKEKLSKAALDLENIQMKKSELEKQIQKENKDITKLTHQNDESANEAKSLEAELQGAEREMKEFEKKTREDEPQVELAEAQYQQYRKCKEEAYRETAEKNETKDKLERQFVAVKNQLKSLETEMDAYKERQKSFQTEAAQFQYEISELGAETKELNGERENLRKELAEYHTKFSALTVTSPFGLYFDSLWILKKIHTKVERIIDPKKKKNQQDQRELLSNMQQMFSGVYGCLADLAPPTSRKYNIAISIALGVNYDAVVVDSKDTCMQCIEYLKQCKRGRMTFIPLNHVRVEPIDQGLRRLGGTAVPCTILKCIMSCFCLQAVDVIKYPEQFEPAVLYALGTTIIVRDLEEARRIAYGSRGQKIRIVCEDGSMISPNGNITGGSNHGNTQDRANRWDENALKRIETKRDDLLQQLRDINDRFDTDKSEEDIQSLIQDVERNLADKNNRIQALNELLKQQQEGLSNVNKEMTKLSPEINKRQKMVNDAREALQNCEFEIREKENKIFAKFLKEVNFSSVQEFEEQKLERIQKRDEQKQALQGNIQEIKNKLEFANSRNVDEQLNATKKKIKDLESQLKTLMKGQSGATSTHKSEEKEYHQLEKQQNELMEELKEQRQEMANLKKQSDQEREAMKKAQTEISSWESLIEKMELSVHNHLREAQLDAVDLREETKRKRKRAKRKRADEKEEKEEEEEEKEEEEEEKKKEEPKIGKKRKRKMAKDKEEKEAGHRRKRRRKEDGSSSDQYESSPEPQEEKRENISGSQLNLNDIDFSAMEANPKARFEDSAEQNRAIKDFKDKIDKLDKELKDMYPNFKADDQYESLAKTYNEFKNEREKLRERLLKATDAYEKVKKDRTDAFMKSYNHVRSVIGAIYGNLTPAFDPDLKKFKSDVHGHANLKLSAVAMPFAQELYYTAQPPGKPFRNMDQLSGGEKSMASLALLFAMHSFNQAPFFVLDEVDAALDKDNVQRLSRFLRDKASKQELSVIVISLKDKFFQYADALVGVYKHQDIQSSGCLHLELKRYS
ncbi:condensin complex component SMC1 [Reticulomyxa filosa]|uniref:Structural maintenance of chromosomes protein n=1 Tax=Reticulomyxa filosa TaxID=46433 RepID=X6P7A0_RETFI|nr:condensin complex component SMC1 [Reticulomyxa filosa]|eukprot:ETO34086.1 condensin complex component SMC1 [Reticulomyxa filosa]